MNATAAATSADVRTISRGIRRLTLFISGLALVVGPLLYLLPDQTATLFAWTITPPLTAAFMGGTYCTALTIEVLAARERVWALARVFFPGMLRLCKFITFHPHSRIERLT